MMTAHDALAILPIMKAPAPMTRVREIKEARGLTSADVVRITGMDPSTLSKAERGIRGVTKNTAPVLAEALQVSIPELYAEVGSPIPNKTYQPLLSSRSNIRLAPDAPDFPNFRGLPQDIPVFGTAEAGSEGTFVINQIGGPIGWAMRGPGLIGMSGVFAIYIEGDSMVPWRKPGSLAYVHENRPPAPGCHVVVELDGGPGNPRRALIKELVRRTPTKLQLRQHNPPETIELDAAMVVRVLRVLEWEDVMGF